MRMLSSPPDFAAAGALQSSYLERQAKLWNALLAGRRETIVEDDDKRFASREWRENPYYDYLRQSYLLAAKYIEEALAAAPRPRRWSPCTG